MKPVDNQQFSELPKTQPKLSDEQRQQLKQLIIAAVREKLGQREQLQDQARTGRQIWQALVGAPTWAIVTADKPPDMPPVTDELWSMIPTVTKQ
jgi:hypothetical protein